MHPSRLGGAVDRLSDLIISHLGRDPLGIQLQVSRSIFALGTMLTLIFNDARTFLGGVQGPALEALCSGAPKFGAFCLFPESVDLVRWLLAIPCLFLLLGILPWLTGLFHLYAAFTVSSNSLVVEGGDQITVNVAALLLVASLSRPQLFGWRERRLARRHLRFIPANVAIIAVSVQLAFVYFEAFADKLATDHWVDGTAMWYWAQNNGGIVYSGVDTLALNILSTPFWTAFFTWGTLLIEIALCLGCLFARRKISRYSLLALGLFFHLMIAIVLGLSTFFLAMAATLIIVFWRPRDAMPWWLFRISKKPQRKNVMELGNKDFAHSTI
jgi:antimicrobial peptide system SdpB family protein